MVQMTQEQKSAWIELQMATVKWREANEAKLLPQCAILDVKRWTEFDKDGRVVPRMEVIENAPWVRLQKAKDTWKEIRPQEWEDS